jgi:hypothetical protein
MFKILNSNDCAFIVCVGPSSGRRYKIRMSVHLSLRRRKGGTDFVTVFPRLVDGGKSFSAHSHANQEM